MATPSPRPRQPGRWNPMAYLDVARCPAPQDLRVEDNPALLVACTIAKNVVRFSSRTVESSGALREPDLSSLSDADPCIHLGPRRGGPVPAWQEQPLVAP